MLEKTDYFILAAAVVSLILSIYLWVQGNHNGAIFVGLWVPTTLGFGNYLKIKSMKKE